MSQPPELLPHQAINSEGQIVDTRLDPRLLGGCTILEHQAASCSASRSAMRASFLTQMLVLEGATPRRIITGAEREYGKRTMRIEVPCECKVVKVLRKYPRHLGALEFKTNSETTIIYESLENGEFGSITIPNFHWNHKVFGFKYVINPMVKTLTSGSLLKKGTILADSTSIRPNGDYCYGLETNVVYMSIPGVIEDGVIVSESYCKRLRNRGYGAKTMEWGVDSYPLNLYGKDKNDYRYFPDIGESIREDGIVFALREYDPVLAICDMTNEALQTVNHIFDKITYISPSSVSNNEMPKVEDISVWHTHNQDLWRTPPTMERQVRRYHEATKIYNTEIYNTYEHERRRRQNKINTTNEFHAKLVRCLVNDNQIPKMQLPKSVARTFRCSKLDDWRVEIKYGWNITPGVGFKVTTLYGGKGVICGVWKDERMPVDDFGNRAELIMYGGKQAVLAITAT